MDCKEKINLIFEITGATNAEVARISKMDPSLISRYRSGSRLPSSSSKHFVDFCNGIVTYSQENSVWDKLHKICQLSDSDTPGNSILQFLLSPDSNTQQNNTKCRPYMVGNNPFGDKLKLLMEILELSNIKLAKALNVDSSLISRLKNGERIPKRGNELIDNMCSYFHRCIKLKGLSSELIKWIGLPEDAIDLEDEIFITHFSNWLLAGTNSSVNTTINMLIDKIESQLPPISPELIPNYNSIFSLKPVEKAEVFYGNKGLQKAIVLLLKDMLRVPNAHTMKIYCDQNLEQVASPQIVSKYLTLLGPELKTLQIKFNIIHNIDTNSSEMIASLEKWLPLYNFDLLEGFYYCSPSSNRFSHTLIVVPEVAVICSTNVFGTENNGLYMYLSAKEKVSYYDKQFKALTKLAKPLFHVFSKQKRQDYYFVINKLVRCNGCIKRLIISPSSITMPSKLLDRIIKRIQINESECKWIIDRHTDNVSLFEHTLTHNQIVEYIYFPELEELKSGKFVINLSDFFIDETIYYNMDEYIEHVKHLILLLEHTNYHIVPLSYIPLNYTRIMLIQPTNAFLKFSNATAVRFNQPLMYNALNQYIETITAKCRLPLNTKDEIIKYLNKYVKQFSCISDRMCNNGSYDNT